MIYYVHTWETDARIIRVLMLKFAHLSGAAELKNRPRIPKTCIWVLCMYACVCMYVFTYICIHGREHNIYPRIPETCIVLCMYACVCMYVFTYICIHGGEHNIYPGDLYI